MIWNGHGARLALTLLAAGGVIACQSSQSNFQGSNFSDETRTLEKELNAEAVALGTAQGVAGIATAAGHESGRHAFGTKAGQWPVR